MILGVLIVVPCVVVAVALVALLDRLGVLPHVDGDGRNESLGLSERVPQLAIIGMLVVLGAWVISWIVLLVVGLEALST